jgi:hypothetical protein
VRRAALATAAPVVLGVMARLMLRPGRHVVRTYGMPAEVARADGHRARAAASLARMRELCAELGLIPPPAARLWRGMGIS